MPTFYLIRIKDQNDFRADPRAIIAQHVDKRVPCRADIQLRKLLQIFPSIYYIIPVNQQIFGRRLRLLGLGRFEHLSRLIQFLRLPSVGSLKNFAQLLIVARARSSGISRGKPASVKVGPFVDWLEFFLFIGYLNFYRNIIFDCRLDIKSIP